MSWRLKADIPSCEHCGRGEDRVYFNEGLTHNLDAIVEVCLSTVTDIVGVPDFYYPDRCEDRRYSWDRFHGHPISELIPIMKEAQKVLCDPSRLQQLIALEPKNRWGTLPDLILEWIDIIRKMEECNRKDILLIADG